MQFSNLQQLETFLANHVNLDTWQTGKAKSTKDLYKELQQGECSLKVQTLADNHQTPKKVLVRYVKCVGVTLWQKPLAKNSNWLFLQETQQTFWDGRIRRRELGVSIVEKCTTEETNHKAVQRAFSEELSFNPHFTLYTPIIQKTTLPSDSYPGTWGTYDALVWNAILPKKYVKDEYIEIQASKTSLWHWRSLPTGVSPPKFGATLA